MGFLDTLRDRFWQWAFPDEMSGWMREYMDAIDKRRNYRRGKQDRQLAVKELQANDNLTVNFTDLVVRRSVSLLLGNGVDWDFGDNVEDLPKEADYIKRMYTVNHEEVLLQKAATFAAEAGTGYIKILPGEKSDAGGELPRLVVVDPLWVEMETDPEDVELILRYIIRFNTADLNGKTLSRKQVIERNLPEAQEDGTLEPREGWMIRDYKAGDSTGGKWEPMQEQDWPYEFAPIVHWQNMPRADSVYGDSDITQAVMDLQDKINFVSSNILRIIRYHAHPRTWGRHAGTSSTQTWGADEMVVFNSDLAEIKNLEMQSDLASSQQFLMFLRQALFDVTQTVDLSSISDKLGALTNFGLRVLYTDAISKLKIKRELLGDALNDLNRRVLTIAGLNPEMAGVPIWDDVLPTSEQEEVQGYEFDLANGLVSKETVSRKRGYDWEKEQERITAQAEGEDNIGAMLLRNFNRGQ